MTSPLPGFRSAPLVGVWILDDQDRKTYFFQRTGQPLIPEIQQLIALQREQARAHTMQSVFQHIVQDHSRSGSPTVEPYSPQNTSCFSVIAPQESKVEYVFIAQSARNTTSNCQPKNETKALKCRKCGVSKDRQWRKGPDGPNTLCNRCGLRYAKEQRDR